MISAQSPVPISSPIFGPAYTSRSKNLADQRCVNLYPEIVETKSGKEIGALYGTPGLDLVVTAGTGPIRGLHVMGTLLYAVSGNKLYAINNVFGPPTQVSSGAGIGGPGGYLYSTGTIAPGFSNIALPFTTSTTDSFVTMADNGSDLAIFVGISVTQQDGFGLIGQPQSYNIYQSNLVDMSTWPATQAAQASADPDYIVAMAQIRREIFVIKNIRTEIWNNAGTTNFSFAREQGPYLEAGCAAPASVAKLGETIFWVAKNDDGFGVVVKVVGYSLQRISSHNIEREIQSWPTVYDAIGYAYQQEGHTFYVLTSPSGDQTWVYDDTLSSAAGIPMWHKRETYSSNPSAMHRHLGNCHASFSGKNLIGDYTNGNIYNYNLNNFTDNGAQRTWLRSWRADHKRSGRIHKYRSLSLDMQTGINIPSTTSPNVMMRWSDDGGHNFSPMRTASAGNAGETSRRIKFNRCGALRAETGYDRIYELSGSDPIPIAIVGALSEED